MPQPSRISAGPELNRGEGLSAWRQIADAIEAEIADGRLPSGRQLPTEAQLAERFGVNRHTVRRALATLTTRGLVRATQGRGTFVESPPLAYPIGRRTRFSEIVAQAGREAWGDLVRSDPAAADQGLAAANRAGHPDFAAHLAGRVAWMSHHHPTRAAKLQNLLRAAVDTPPGSAAEHGG